MDLWFSSLLYFTVVKGEKFAKASQSTSKLRLFLSLLKVQNINKKKKNKYIGKK